MPIRSEISKFSLLVTGWASLSCLRYGISLMLARILFWIGITIFGTMRTSTGIMPDDSVSMLMVVTSRLLFVDVLAPNADRLTVSFLVGQRPSFVASNWVTKERWAPSSKSRLASARLLLNERSLWLFLVEMFAYHIVWAWMLTALVSTSWEFDPLVGHF